MIEQIDNEIKESMKKGDKFTLSVLRMLKSEFINESRKGTLHELTDEEAVKVIKKQVKIRKDSREEFIKYGKTDLADNLEKEIEILSKYLPEEMSEEELSKIVEEVFEIVKPTSMKDMGNIMREVSAKAPNADKALVSKIVKDRLNN